ncbi:MAG TPA: aldo/keto reductase [Egibacteraceae bacterium]
MRYRLLGRTGLRVSELFLGAMVFGHPHGSSPAESAQMLDLYAEAGGNVIDTASAYGDSEAILGELLAGRRDRFVVATKYTLSRDHGDVNAAGNHRKNLRSSLEASLRRLRTDYIDLLWVHVWDRHTPIEETLRALDDAVSAGKVLYVGFSDVPAWVVSRADAIAEWRGWTPFAAVQVPYNLLQRDIERDVLPMAEHLGLTVAAWGPLAGGVLSGKHSGAGHSSPPTGTRVDVRSLSARDHAAARAVMAVADEIGATASQVAIAWARARSRAIHPIVGARSVAQLKDDLGAVDVVLPPEAVQRLDAAVEFDIGFPTAFLDETSTFVYGEPVNRVDGR